MGPRACLCGISKFIEIGNLNLSWIHRKAIPGNLMIGRLSVPGQEGFTGSPLMLALIVGGLLWEREGAFYGGKQHR